MNKPMRAIVLSLTMLAGSTVAFAAPPSHAPAWGYDQNRGGDDRHDNRRDDRYDHQDRHNDRGRYDRDDSRFSKGDRLPSQYRNNRYYVDDWRDHHLSKPPRGHRWVEVDGEYILISVVTGVIASILLGHGY